jgi:hypothetical protein
LPDHYCRDCIAVPQRLKYAPALPSYFHNELDSSRAPVVDLSKMNVHGPRMVLLRNPTSVIVVVVKRSAVASHNVIVHVQYLEARNVGTTGKDTTGRAVADRVGLLVLKDGSPNTCYGFD